MVSCDLSRVAIEKCQMGFIGNKALMNKFIDRFLKIIGFVCIAVFCVAMCCASLVVANRFVPPVAASDSGEPDIYKNLRVFTDVLALVRKNYVQEVKFNDLIEGAIKGMLVTLDPHSGYMNSETFKELQVETKGRFGGLGIEITVKDGLLTVVAPIEDSPAFRAGVRSGDQIIKIGDEFTKDLLLVDAVKKMRGPKGTPITISVHREGRNSLIPITVVRDVIQVKSVKSRMLEDRFGYVRLSQFQDGSASEFYKSLEELTKKASHHTLEGLVIDLRNNPGGLLTQAIRVADLFLEDGVIVYTDGRLESQKQKYYAHKEGNEPKYPIVVLVNEGSASASEIVAGALQDHKRALIVGKQTFGKGSVQTILPMDEGCALRLTTALYYTKSGRSIQAKGVSPDVTVSAKRYPSDNEELLEEDEGIRIKEKNLPRAIENPDSKNEPKDVKEGEGNSESKQTPKKLKDSSEQEIEDGAVSPSAAMEMDLSKLLALDPQLDEALRLLKTWHVFQNKPSVPA